MSVLGKRNVINKVYKVLELSLVQSEIIVGAKTESKLHKSLETEKTPRCSQSSPAMER